MNKNLRIIISRTDGIGDVILTLPVAGIIKKLIPTCTVIFLGRTYTKPLADACIHIDEFAAWDHEENNNSTTFLRQLNADVIIHVFPDKEIARSAYKAEIPIRIGSSHRLYNLLYCNKRINFTRKRSDLHEAQLNLKLLKPLRINVMLEKSVIPFLYGITQINPLKPEFKSLLDRNKFNLILHPKSKGSAREWGLENYLQLIKLSDPAKYKIFITGTIEERESMQLLFSDNELSIVDMTGRLDLEQLISFINEADGLIACSTGPLHIASALGKTAIGIYPSIRPMHPGRWAPLGKNATYVSKDNNCNKCRKKKVCECIQSITPSEVINLLIQDYSLLLTKRY